MTVMDPMTEINSFSFAYFAMDRAITHDPMYCFRGPELRNQEGVILSAPKSRTREVENSHILSIC